jgi:hypothetical protein
VEQYEQQVGVVDPAVAVEVGRVHFLLAEAEQDLSRSASSTRSSSLVSPMCMEAHFGQGIYAA